MTLRYFLAHTYKRLTRKHLHRAQLRRLQRQLFMAQCELEYELEWNKFLADTCQRAMTTLATDNPLITKLLADNKQLRDGMNHLQLAHGILLKDFSDTANRLYAAKAENKRLRSTLDDYHRNYHGKVPELERQLRGLNLDMRRLTEQHVSLQQREKAQADQLAHDQRHATALSVINRMLKRKLAQLRALKPKPAPKKRRKR